MRWGPKDPGTDARHGTRPAWKGSTRGGDPMSEGERRGRDAGIDILTRVDRVPEAGHVSEPIEPRGCEDGGEFGIVQQILFDRAAWNVRSEVLPVGQVPQVRRHVVERCAGVTQPRDVHVDLARPYVLHDRGRPRAERFFYRARQLDRVEADAVHRIGKWALAVVRGDDEDVLAGITGLEVFHQSPELLIDRSQHQ